MTDSATGSGPDPNATARRALSALPTWEEAYGAGIVGPLYAHFVHRLAERCRDTGVSRIYFMARDGFLLRRLFEIIAPAVFAPAPIPTCHYLCVSRRTSFLAASASLGARELDHLLSYCAKPTLRALLSPFAPEPSLLARLVGLTEAGDADATLPGLLQWPPFLRLWEDAELLRLVRARHDEVKPLLGAYLEQQNFFAPGAVALVDVGWRGRVQDNLVKAFAGRADMPVVHGFYMGIGWPAQGLGTDRSFFEGLIADEAAGGWRTSATFDFVQCFEAVGRAPHGTVVGYRSAGAQGAEPIMAAPEVQSRRAELADEPVLSLLQGGIVAFAQAYGGALSGRSIPAASSQRSALLALERLIRFPRAEEAELWLTMVHAADFGIDRAERLGTMQGLLQRLGQHGPRAFRGARWLAGELAPLGPALSAALLAYRGARRPPPDLPARARQARRASQRVAPSSAASVDDRLYQAMCIRQESLRAEAQKQRGPGAFVATPIGGLRPLLGALAFVVADAGLVLRRRRRYRHEELSSISWREVGRRLVAWRRR